mmetsp:Transcript_4696/g.6430  ORF Transcript_4696/g.6430 Transcript_4696/m.6430 type:complete len:97 (-) Transcript_4696:1727-2017(-)
MCLQEYIQNEKLILYRRRHTEIAFKLPKYDSSFEFLNQLNLFPWDRAMPADDRGRDPFVLLLLMGLGLLLSLTFFTTTALEPDPGLVADRPLLSDS